MCHPRMILLVEKKCCVQLKNIIHCVKRKWLVEFLRPPGVLVSRGEGLIIACSLGALVIILGELGSKFIVWGYLGSHAKK